MLGCVSGTPGSSLPKLCHQLCPPLNMLVEYPKAYTACRRTASVLTLFTSYLSLYMVAGFIVRCTDNEDCPSGGFCFKDECARCLCAEGYFTQNFVNDKKLTHVCTEEPEPTNPTRVFDSCSRKQMSRRRCPLFSHCDEMAAACLCNRGLRPHEDMTRCRLGIYNEPCSRRRQKCDMRRGLTCAGNPGRCKCMPSFHPPSNWTRYVLTRWDYSKVVGEPQECVARAVGEPCQSVDECKAVEGSGALCGLCGFCECKEEGHVPDALGTKCGLGIGIHEKCTLRSKFVCDGSRGLHCGDMCDTYSETYDEMLCLCSQMYDRVGNICIAKKVGSPCYTDIDCYPVTEGFGYCEGGRCRADVEAAGPSYRPYMASRACSIQRPMSTSMSTSTSTLTLTSTLARNGPDKQTQPNSTFLDYVTNTRSLEVTTHNQSTEVNVAREVSSAGNQSPSLVIIKTGMLAVFPLVLLLIASR